MCSILEPQKLALNFSQTGHPNFYGTSPVRAAGSASPFYFLVKGKRKVGQQVSRFSVCSWSHYLECCVCRRALCFLTLYPQTFCLSRAFYSSPKRLLFLQFQTLSTFFSKLHLYCQSLLFQPSVKTYKVKCILSKRILLRNMKNC